MASHATHIRRIYGRPWRNGSLANPGKIPTCIQVSVRPETTGTLETMLEPCPQLPAGRAGLAAVGRIDIHDGDRSEEHTSELQSQSNLVCRLLLDTKHP